MRLSTEELKAFGKGVQERMEETLEQALKRCYGDASKSLYSQAKIACQQVSEAVRIKFNAYGTPPGGYDAQVRDVSSGIIQEITASWYREGLSPATINKRLNCLSKMGVSVEGLRVKNPKKLKWYLKESDKDKLIAYLVAAGLPVSADFIEWTTLTGLRIEESLRLCRKDVDFEAGTITVPGTKTSTSHATLPLGREAERILARRAGVGNNARGLPTSPIFGLTYEDVLNAWNKAREQFGWKDDPTATLKALRRSAARYLHVDCGMPLHMVQQYLRHESMDTTLEYLRLTGGYGTEEMRRYLK